MVRPPVLADELSLSCTRLVAGRLTTLLVKRPLTVNQHGQLSQPSLRGRLNESDGLLLAGAACGRLLGVAARSLCTQAVGSDLSWTASRPSFSDESALEVYSRRRAIQIWRSSCSSSALIRDVRRHLFSFNFSKTKQSIFWKAWCTRESSVDCTLSLHYCTTNRPCSENTLFKLNPNVSVLLHSRPRCSQLHNIFLHENL